MIGIDDRSISPVPIGLRSVPVVPWSSSSPHPQAEAQGLPCN